MPRPALPLFRPVLPRLVAWVGAQAGFATVLAASYYGTPFVTKIIELFRVEVSLFSVEIRVLFRV